MSNLPLSPSFYRINLKESQPPFSGLYQPLSIGNFRRSFTWKSTEKNRPRSEMINSDRQGRFWGKRGKGFYPEPPSFEISTTWTTNSSFTGYEPPFFESHLLRTMAIWGIWKRTDDIEVIYVQIWKYFWEKCSIHQALFTVRLDTLNSKPPLNQELNNQI